MGYKDAEKKREYQRNWMAARRAAFFAGKSCVQCGGNESLELDHVDPSLKIDHKIWSWSTARRIEEIKKCQVLCRNCHMDKSTSAITVGHGGGGQGVAHCKCIPCSERKRKYMRELMRRLRKEERERKELQGCVGAAPPAGL